MNERCEFIDGERTVFPLVMMCRVLKVSRSGFYAWAGRPASATTARRRELQVEIYEIFYRVGRERYGYRRVHAVLARRGIEAGPELVRFLMRDLGLVPVQPRPRRRTTIADPGAAATPDLVGRDFTAERVGQVMVGSGSRRDSHPPAPTEPCVIVSHYTAPATLITRNCGTNASGRTFRGIVV